MGHKIHDSFNYLGYLDMRARKVLNVSKALMIWRSAGVKGPQDLEDF